MIQHSIGRRRQSSQAEKEIKGVQIRKEEVKSSVFADDIVLYVENPKDSTKKLLETKKYSKIAGYKVNVQEFITALAGVAQWTECLPANQRVTSSIPDWAQA